MSQQKKRPFTELRELILSNLSSGQKTINQVSSETGINWKTVDNHITFLIGRGLAREVFSSSYVRIVEITERGLEQMQQSAESGRVRKKPRRYANFGTDKRVNIL